jgi:hypothetical protein
MYRSEIGKSILDLSFRQVVFKVELNVTSNDRLLDVMEMELFVIMSTFSW